jgi:hypothetical protein
MGHVRAMCRWYHLRKVTGMAMRTDDSGKLVHAEDVHADSQRHVDVPDKLGSVGTARPRALVE